MILHVYKDTPDAVAVWLDFQASKDGQCIGTGPTERLAYRDALATLRVLRTDLKDRLHLLDLAEARS